MVLVRPRVLTMMAFRTLCVVFLALIKGCHSQQDVCGTANLNTKIVGGQNAGTGSWPWQVSLQKSGQHFCGGSLINKDWVMSAVHCFSSSGEVTVVLGLQTLVGSNPNIQTRTVAKVVKHPNYNSQTNDNDIALLQLSSSVSFNSYITPVCLASSGSTTFNGTATWVTGWGTIGTGVSLPSPGTLQEVQVSVIGNRKCNCDYGVGKITSNMLCAGSLLGGKDSCQGDSGGPLVTKQNSRWIQLGIVSFGIGCALEEFPGVYARVSAFEDFIKTTITTNQPGFIQYISSGSDSDLQVTCAGLANATTTPSTTAAPVVCGSATLKSDLGNSSSVASAGAYPWMASLQFNGTHVCGGTLIAEQFVLSSANCFTRSANSSDWTVKLGRLNQNGSNPHEVSVSVVDIRVSNSTTNNIAVLQLSSKPTLSSFIQPICVDMGNTSIGPGSQCWAAGWGSGGGVLQTLQQFNTTVVSCDNTSSSASICTEAIPLEQTEQGGSLMCKNGPAWFQVAVLTLNSTSADSNSTANSTSSSNSATGSKSLKSIRTEITLPRAQNTQVFTKISTFSSFLEAVVGSFPPPVTSNNSPGGCEALSSLPITSVFLLSLIAVIQSFVLE